MIRIKYCLIQGPLKGAFQDLLSNLIFNMSRHTNKQLVHYIGDNIAIFIPFTILLTSRMTNNVRLQIDTHEGTVVPNYMFRNNVTW